MRVSVLLVLAVGVVLGLTTFLGEGSSSTAAPSSPRPAASTFARAYLRVLQGKLSPAQLPDASARVRSIAASAQASAPGRISAAATLGAITLRYVSGASIAQAVVQGRDGARVLPFDLGLAFAGGRWTVTYLVAPDLGTALAAPRRVVATPLAIRRSAARFALAYTDFRAGVSRVAPDGLPALRAQVAAGRDPLAGSALTRSPARLRSLTFAAQQGDLIAVTADVQDGSAHPRFSFVMQRTARGAWLAWQFPQEQGE